MKSRKDLQNLESLYMLSVTAEHGGKRKAAETLGTSVDTISKYIGGLESELGIKLLTSNGRGSVLTPKGLLLTEEFRKLRQVLSNVYALKPEKNEVRGTVRVIMNAGTTAGLLNTDMEDFVSRFPQINLLIEYTYERPRLSDLAYDVGISYFEPTGVDEVLMGKKKVSCGCFASREYLERYGSPKNLDDLIENYRLINFENTMLAFNGWKDIVKKARHISYTTNSTYSLVEVIRGGVGIGVLPLRYKEKGLVCLENIPCSDSFVFHLFAHRRAKDIPRVRSVIEYYLKMLDLI